MKHVIRSAAAVLVTGWLAAPHAFAQNAPGDRQDKENQTITASGCLSVNPAARMYVLTATPSDISQTGRAIASEPTTIAYQLIGGDGLQQHVGDKIEVTGRVEPDTTTTAKTDTKRSTPPRNAGESKENARVKTTTEAKIRAQVLRVESFRFVESNCKPTAGAAR